MGSFNSTCSVSHMTLINQKTSILLLVPGFSKDFEEHKSMIASNEGCQTFFSPFGFPIHGQYDDYGYIDNIKRDKNVEMIEEYFGVDIETIINNIGDDRDIPDELKNKEFYLTLAKTYFRSEVLEYLEIGWDGYELENPVKYTHSEMLSNILQVIEPRSNKKTLTDTERELLYEKMENKNEFVNDLLVNDIKKRTFNSSEGMDIISHHTQVKRDRKINILVD